MKIKIAGGPTASGMSITNIDGTRVNGITGIQFNPMVAGEPISATVDVLVEHVDLEAEAILSLASVTAAAAHYGYRLTPLAEDGDGTADPQAGA